MEYTNKISIITAQAGRIKLVQVFHRVVSLYLPN
jgi:hypothetical protein